MTSRRSSRKSDTTIDGPAATAKSHGKSTPLAQKPLRLGATETLTHPSIRATRPTSKKLLTTALSPRGPSVPKKHAPVADPAPPGEQKRSPTAGRAAKILEFALAPRVEMQGADKGRVLSAA